MHEAPAPDSPWRIALGDDFALLHPRLIAYFSAIPVGRVGRGTGTFDRVGTPRRWLWPLLRVLQRRRILFPIWEHDVPFTVENRPDGAALRAVRTFRFAHGTRRMVDVVTVERGRLIDRLGDGGRLRTELTASVREGALVLVSRSSRWGRMPIPLAPRLHLIERFDEAVGRQHVSLTLESVVGRVYEYSGHFDYRIESA